MQLSKLLDKIPTSLMRGSTSCAEVEIRHLAYDSRTVVRNSLFFAIQGRQFDGHQFIGEAAEKGAVAVASERTPDPCFAGPWLRVTSIRQFMALCANFFFGEPSRILRLAGITGTNGKTTTTHLVHSILNQASPAVMIGTIKTVIGERSVESDLTTPESVDIQRILEEAVQRNCEAGIVEVSSHALLMRRVFGCFFPFAVFTNLSPDHLDFHGTIQDYFEAKRLLFSPRHNPGLEYAIVNGDDHYGSLLAKEMDRSVTIGLSTDCAVKPIQYETDINGTKMELDLFGRSLELKSHLSGRHNIYNILAAATTCAMMGISDEKIRRGVDNLCSVPGRFEPVDMGQPFSVIIDFAHTPDAMENLLILARGVAKGRIICVFGCGGNRDRAKRPQMGAIATQLSDIAIITSDNPRTEDPEEIIHDIEAGISNASAQVESIVDRRTAIRRALTLAQEGDTVILAGKGHETYQDIGGEKRPFDERQIVKEVMCST